MSHRPIEEVKAIVNGNGAPKKVKQWAKQYAEHKAFCYEHFEGRAETVLGQAKRFAEETSAGPIQALDICMQVEAEFPGRVEECIDRASEHPNGMIPGLGQYIRHLRNTNG